MNNSGTAMRVYTETSRLFSWICYYASSTLMDDMNEEDEIVTWNIESVKLEHFDQAGIIVNVLYELNDYGDGGIRGIYKFRAHLLDLNDEELEKHFKDSIEYEKRRDKLNKFNSIKHAKDCAKRLQDQHCDEINALSEEERTEYFDWLKQNEIEE